MPENSGKFRVSKKKNLGMPRERPIQGIPGKLHSAEEGPARHLDVSRQKLSPHCLVTIFDSQLPSPKLSPKVPPKMSLAHKRGLFSLSQNDPRGEGNCETIEKTKIVSRQFLSRSIKMSLLAHFILGIPNVSAAQHINFISPQNAENGDPKIRNRDGPGNSGNSGFL